MSLSRRGFLVSGGMAAGAAAASATTAAAEPSADMRLTMKELDAIASQPVLEVGDLRAAVVLESIELFRNGREHFVRVRSKDGAEGLSFANAEKMGWAYPVFLECVAPFLIGKDLRRWEELLWELYRHRSNYKLQGLLFWTAQTAAEIAVLDLLGKQAGRSIGELLGGVQRREVMVYRASSHRGNPPEDEVRYLQRIVNEVGAKAVKFRLGGRMSKNADSRPGRSEALIPLVREAFGDDMTLYADANSSYDAAEGIRIGRLMEQYNYGFFEEPCRFDHLEETKQVADALDIPIAGGEQEFSEWRFKRMIQDRMVDIVQPDLHYYGGMVRAMRVARMAEAAGMLCVPHMSGSGLGYLDAVHFVSASPNPGPYHEFKGNITLPITSETSSLKAEGGVVTVPSGPGYDITLDPDYINKSRKLGEVR